MNRTKYQGTLFPLLLEWDYFKEPNKDHLNEDPFLDKNGTAIFDWENLPSLLFYSDGVGAAFLWNALVLIDMRHQSHQQTENGMSKPFLIQLVMLLTLNRYVPFF